MAKRHVNCTLDTEIKHLREDFTRVELLVKGIQDYILKIVSVETKTEEKLNSTRESLSLAWKIILIILASLVVNLGLIWAIVSNALKSLPRGL